MSLSVVSVAHLDKLKSLSMKFQKKPAFLDGAVLLILSNTNVKTRSTQLLIRKLAKYYPHMFFFQGLKISVRPTNILSINIQLGNNFRTEIMQCQIIFP